MNQPTEDRIKKIEDEQRQLKEEVQQLREQITEPINLRIERGLSLGEEAMLKTVMDMSGRHATELAVLKDQVQGVQNDVSQLKQDVGTLKQDVSTLKTDMEKRLDAIAKIQQLILARLPQPPEP